MTGPRIVVYPDITGQFRWHLLATNGEVVLQGEGHRDQHDAIRAVKKAGQLLAMAIVADDIELEGAGYTLTTPMSEPGPNVTGPADSAPGAVDVDGR